MSINRIKKTILLNCICAIGICTVTATVQKRSNHKKPKKAAVVQVAGYRVVRNGETFQLNARGVELLKSGVQRGYETGYREAQLDRTYGRTGGYNGSATYQDGTSGWQDGVDRGLYQYYFQQGFERGYSDGYNSQSRFGYRNGNAYLILGSVLNSILGIKSY